MGSQSTDRARFTIHSYHKLPEKEGGQIQKREHSYYVLPYMAMWSGEEWAVTWTPAFLQVKSAKQGNNLYTGGHGE